MKVSQFMTANPVTLKEHYTIRQAAEIFLEHGIDGVPVVDVDGKILGLFTKTHLYRAYINNYPGWTPVRRLLRKNITMISAASPAREAWETAQRENIGRLPVVDDAGKLVGMMTRTDLVRAFEQGMVDTINHLNAVLESAHNGIYAIDRNGVLITYNKAAESLVGIKAPEALGKNLADLDFDEELLTVLRTGRPQSGRNMSINGKAVAVNRTPVFAENKITGAVALIQDISELESISRELSEAKELYQELNAVINSSYDGIVTVDKNGRVIQHNRAYDQIAPDIDLVIKDISQAAMKKDRPVTKAHGLPDGKELLLTANPVQRKITRVVVNCRDITELNQLRREVETTKELYQIYHSELESLRTRYLGHTMVCHSEVMRNILDLAIRVAGVDSSILLLGESGVGKDVITTIIHKASKRAGGPFIRINCGAIPENLLESELFGYEPGAFTGASRDGKPGLLELAHGGTLFLDEVAELPPSLQVKLLTYSRSEK